MKKSVLVVFMVISLSAMCQKKDSVQQVTDSTAIFSLKDLNEIDQLIQKQFTISEAGKYQTILQFMQQLVSTRVKEYQLKNQKQKQ